MKQFMIGNSHIDPVWFWSWQEGYQEVKATFRSALDRMKETPEFIFTCACADYYRWVEENAPDMFEEIRSRVKEGRWVIVGGMWIQPDMNTAGGESLARQLLYSQRYFMERFGIAASVGYNVDSFGHNATMPQLYRKAGIVAYLWMRPSKAENPNIPEGAMIWKSADGSTITAYRIYGEYLCNGELTEKIDRMFAYAQKRNQPVITMYGVGNHGGGPTIANLEAIRRYQRESGKGGDVVFASPADYFAELERERIELPVWSTELQHHASGCYSTHSRSKYLHRKTENALLRQEKLGVLSGRLTRHLENRLFLTQAWRNLMFVQFHDVMGGCCAERVLDDMVQKLQESCSIAAREENAALQKISWQVNTVKGQKLERSKDEDWSLWGRKGQGTPVVVFNPHEFEATDTVRLLRPVRKVCEDSGNEIPVQKIRAERTNGEDKWDAVFRATVPAMGYRLYWIYLEEGTAQVENLLRISGSCLENEYIRADIDPKTGMLDHLIDKRSGLDVINGGSRVCFLDISHCDTWAHNVFAFDKEAGEFSLQDMTVLESGPVRGAIRVRQTYGLSTLEQVYRLEANSDQLTVNVTADIHERHRMIKLCFRTPFADGKDIAEIPYGMLQRRAGGEEEHCQRWCGIQDRTGGFVIINDGRYSYSAKNGELCMTIANTSLYADHYGQGQRDDTCRYMDQGEMKFSYVLRPYKGTWQQQKLHQRAALLHQRFPFVVETYHEGDLPTEYCGLQFDNDAIALGALKRAEDERGYILRMYETTGTHQTLRAGIVLLERQLILEFTPWEIKTVYLPDDNIAEPYEVLLTEWKEDV